ncbi:MAG TPA: hypothetical protein V6C52_00760 [Coleofasciculaceae cyanobacterium]|jgi:hypothetical protein
MDDEQQLSYQRWYDKHQTVSKSVKLLETFPEEIQVIISEGIVRLAIRECQANELMDNLRSLGPEKVLGIFKSKNKRRSYDNNSTVHQAMNYLYIMTDENRLFIAGQVIEIVNFIYEYLKECKKFKMSAQLEDVSSITQAYIESGSDEARRLLAGIQQRFTSKVSERSVGNDEFLSEDQKGLKIREDWFRTL